MRAALLEKAQEPLSIVADVEISDPGPREVVVKVANCGICHSDLSMVDNAGGTPLPVILGHEAAGVVEAVGTGVTRLAKGDSVMLTPLPPCGHCYYCVRQQPTLCVDAQGFMTGTRADGSSPLSRGDATVYRGFGLGGWGEYTVVGENSAIKIPEDTPLEVACVIGCAIQTGVGAVLNTAKVEEGATVLVTGLGGIGISIVQGARLAGASRIIVSDPVPERRDYAANFGATDILDPGQDDIVARAVELTGGIGVDYAFDGAGMHELIQQCIQASRIGGTTVMVGAPMDLRPLEIPIPALFLTHEKKVMGSLLGSCHSHRDVPRFLALWRAGKLDLESMVSHRRPVEEVNAGLDDMRAARGLRTVLSF
ncbi:MAG: Zn-dependent alcohol dehydrogenase [Deltaproteobacteria bacterium]|jgi:Zn-dependent alcohol dehydrogenase|nr:Zn-dependent alcohol dehydrogenase [Deltaproteobacteria bacterium]